MLPITPETSIDVFFMQTRYLLLRSVPFRCVLRRSCSHSRPTFHMGHLFVLHDPCQFSLSVICVALTSMLGVAQDTVIAPSESNQTQSGCSTQMCPEIWTDLLAHTSDFRIRDSESGYYLSGMRSVQEDQPTACSTSDPIHIEYGRVESF